MAACAVTRRDVRLLALLVGLLALLGAGTRSPSSGDAAGAVHRERVRSCGNYRLAVKRLRRKSLGGFPTLLRLF